MALGVPPIVVCDGRAARRVACACPTLQHHAWGSHGLTRQAGPLHQDTVDQINEKKPENKSIELVDKKIGYTTPNSLPCKENLLKAVRKKDEWVKL